MGVGAAPVTVIAPGRLRTVDVHAGGVEAGLGGILVGVILVVGVVSLVGMIAVFVTLRIPLGVRMGALAVRMTPLTLPPAGRERDGKRGGKKNSEHRRGPVAVHDGKCLWLESSSKRTGGLRQVERLPHCSEQREVSGPEVGPEVHRPKTGIAVGVRRVEEFDEGHVPFAVAGLGNAEQIARTA